MYVAHEALVLLKRAVAAQRKKEYYSSSVRYHIFVFEKLVPIIYYDYVMYSTMPLYKALADMVSYVLAAKGYWSTAFPYSSAENMNGEGYASTIVSLFNMFGSNLLKRFSPQEYNRYVPRYLRDYS